MHSIEVWNKAAYSHHINALLQKYDTFWVKWTIRYNIGTKNFWLMKVPQSCSWIWRSILKLRHTFKPLVQIKLSKASVCKFWSDPWLGKGIVLDQLFTYQQKQQSRITGNALAVDHIVNGKSVLPYSSNQIVRAFWRHYDSCTFVHYEHDTVLWNDQAHTVSGVYKTMHGLDAMPDCK